MKLLIIRHADPDYAIDSLTQRGWREAGLLAERLARMDITDFYVSPMGRAKDTASLTLGRVEREAVECEWLREFSPRIHRPDTEKEKNVWDWLPQDWTVRDEFYRQDQWYEAEELKAGKVKEEYEWVTRGLDDLLKAHGYVREGRYYRAERPNQDTLALFCHFGVGCVLLSHLIGASPMVLWHGFCAAPSSVTTVYTEERRKGIASFRVSAYGDTSHLYMYDEEPSFSARFCERYENTHERHD